MTTKFRKKLVCYDYIVTLSLNGMKKTDKINLEIVAKKKSVRIELHSAAIFESEYDWDKNYIDAKVYYSTEISQGYFETKFMTIDFEKFKRDLKNIYNTDFVLFECLSNSLKLILKGNGESSFYMEYRETEFSETHTLKFNFLFNSKQNNSILNQLEKITEAFPIIGNEFRIKKAPLNYSENQSIRSNGSSINYSKEKILVMASSY